jgi:isoleucyl-tRNA synthetase
MPGKRGESVFLETWHTPPAPPDGAIDHDFWNDVIAVRQAVAKELEKLRVAGGIGSGLDAEVDLYCDPARQVRLHRLGDELRFVFITSYVRVHPLEARLPEAVETELKGLYVQVAPSAHPKCIRCWHHREDVGVNKEHPQICARCVQNITGAGETRSYA